MVPGNTSIIGTFLLRLPIQNHPKSSTTKKCEIRLHTRFEMPQDLILWRFVCQELWISSATSSATVAPDLSEDLAIPRHKCPETILTNRKKAAFLKVIKMWIIYKFFKNFINQRRKTKYWKYKCRQYANMYERFRFAVLQNYHWSAIKIWCLWQIKDGDHLLSQLGRYRKIMHFQMSSRKENRLRHTCVIKTWVLRKDFRK